MKLEYLRCPIEIGRLRLRLPSHRCSKVLVTIRGGEFPLPFGKLLQAQQSSESDKNKINTVVLYLSEMTILFYGGSKKELEICYTW